LQRFQLRDFAVSLLRIRYAIFLKIFSTARIQHGICLKRGMRAVNSENISHDSAGLGSSPAVAEIHAYLAARNLVLREAEENTTEWNLRRAASANEFAENCLRLARSPYQAQALPEAEAARERQHCQAVKMRLAELRTRLGRRHRAA
jgi:hypothetical protein